LDLQPTWGGGLAAQTTIPLEPLPPEEAEALAAQLVPVDEGSFDLARLVEVAGGNPLFLEELAASVVELGGRDDLPVTVKEAISGRIDALPPDARSALLSAAVVGKTFWRGLVEAAGGIEDVDRALAVLEARDLVRRGRIRAPRLGERRCGRSLLESARAGRGRRPSTKHPDAAWPRARRAR